MVPPPRSLGSTSELAPRFSHKRIVTAVLLAALTLALPCFAATVSGDGAGNLPSTALDFTGLDNKFTIQGSLPYDPNAGTFAEAVFKIDLSAYQFFSAATVTVTGGHFGFGIPDTELFLFDSSGNGVYANDDVSASNTLSFLPNPSGGLGPALNGIYYLGISFSADMPIDAVANELFSPSSSTDVVAANLGVGSIAGWDHNVFASPDTDLIYYQIDVTTGVPEPSTLVLLLPGLAAVWRRYARIGKRN